MNGIDLTPGELLDVLEALDYRADDLAERARYDADNSYGEADNSANYHKASRKTQRLASALRQRAGIEVAS